MVDRINLILKAKNITARQFAEEIGIQPSGMSHILSGRNRPSLDFVMKVVTRYPEIDIKWLTLGEGEMFVHPHSMPVAPSAAPVVSRTETAADGRRDMADGRRDVVENRREVSEDVAAERNAAEPDLFSSVEPAAANVQMADTPMLAFGESEDPDFVGRPSMNPHTEPVVPAERTIVEDQPPAAPVDEVRKPQVAVAENRVFENAQTPAHVHQNVVKKRIIKVVILYDDHSFSEYYPE